MFRNLVNRTGCRSFYYVQNLACHMGIIHRSQTYLFKMAYRYKHCLFCPQNMQTCFSQLFQLYLQKSFKFHATMKLLLMALLRTPYIQVIYSVRFVFMGDSFQPFEKGDPLYKFEKNNSQAIHTNYLISNKCISRMLKSHVH